MSDDDRSAPNWREIERELVDLFRSFGRATVRDVCGEPTIRYVRTYERVTDDAIYTDGVNSLSLTFLARLIANRFRGPPQPCGKSPEHACSIMKRHKMKGF